MWLFSITHFLFFTLVLSLHLLHKAGYWSLYFESFFFLQKQKVLVSRILSSSFIILKLLLRILYTLFSLCIDVFFLIFEINSYFLFFLFLNQRF